MTRDPQFEIALSFAGEDRPYVDQVANLLRSSGVKVFYDLFEESSLWGKNLYDYLSDVYQNKALYTIMFISKTYAGKLWPTHERQAMPVTFRKVVTPWLPFKRPGLRVAP
jgi:hypothetical protein